jgi:hypothetical protein
MHSLLQPPQLREGAISHQNQVVIQLGGRKDLFSTTFLPARY